ncbi:MAG TPA: FAD-binding protein, partial [Dehalococcoidia bacterium]|nr:FAD-binding protein [Dehalococcoidia bacterium]
MKGRVRALIERESIKTDVLVIGSGAAGMMAALVARRAGAAVTLVTK